MNLPILGPIQNDRSTYITFSKALLDFDRCINTNKNCYFTKMVALNIPNWQSPDFFIDLLSINIVDTDPNVVLPKAIQYYMENIIRQSIGTNDVVIEEVVEIAFWKLMKKLGVTDLADRQSIVTFVNETATSNFITTENNNGWGELVCQIPNKCKSLNKSWKVINTIADIVQCNDTDTCLFDNGDKQFLFDTDTKKVIDFANLTFDEVVQQTFDFNCLLLYYTDDTGIQKIHGINFIYPFEYKVSYWDMTKFTQNTNVSNTVGYQFKFNLKTVNNDASVLQVYELQEHTHWNTFAETLKLMNSFLEIKMRENQIL